MPLPHLLLCKRHQCDVKIFSAPPLAHRLCITAAVMACSALAPTLCMTSLPSRFDSLPLLVSGSNIFAMMRCTVSWSRSESSDGAIWNETRSKGAIRYPYATYHKRSARKLKQPHSTSNVTLCSPDATSSKRLKAPGS